jgi:hypothetical protein
VLVRLSFAYGSENVRLLIYLYTYFRIIPNDFLLAYDCFEIYKDNMAQRERFTTTLDSELLEQLKILAIYEKCTTNKLLEEAIEDLLKKYKKKLKQ